MENLNVTNFTADVVPKKKKTGVIIGVAAAVLVGGSGVAYAAVPVVHNTVNMTVMSPEKYCTSVYENSIDECLKEYDSKTQAAEKITGGSITMTVEPDSDTMSMIESQLGQEIFDKLSISVDAKQCDSSISSKISLSADDKEVASANVLGFSESGKIYAQVPGLSDKYLYADCSDVLGDEFGQTYKNSMKKIDAGFYNDYKELFKKYSKEFIKVISKGTSELEKGVEGRAADVDYKYNQVTTVLKADDINPFIQDLIEEIKNDDKLKDFCKKIYGESVVDELFEQFDDIKNDPDSYKVESDITVKTLIDAEGTIRGIDFINNDDEIGFKVAKKDDNIGFELISSNKPVLSVKAVQSGNSYTGTLTIDNGEDDAVVINFEDFEIVDDMYINGSISTDLSEFTDNKFKTLSLAFNAVDNGQNISTEIDGVGKFSIEALISKDSVENAEEPKDAISTDEIDKYLDGVDTKAYLDEALGKLGFTYEQVESMVNGIQSMFGLNDYSYDDDYNYDDDDYNFDDDDFDINDSYLFDENTVEIDQAFEELKFVLNGKQAQLPAITEEMLPEGSSDKTIAGGEYDSVFNDDYSLFMSFQNTSTDTLPISQCKLFSISSSSEKVEFSVNSIRVGSTITDITMRFPDAQIKDDTTSVCIIDPSSENTINFSIDNGVVTTITCYFM